MRLIYSFGIGSVLANSCLNPDTQFPNTSSLNAKKKEVCDNFKDGRYCYAKCLDKYYPPPTYETKSTKITCECEGGKKCFWKVSKPFIGCIGPCEQPIRAVSNIKQFFKIKKDYSEETAAFPNTSNALHVVLRVQNKTPLSGWTLALHFKEPQDFEIAASDVTFEWNCRRNILLAQPREFNFEINAKKSHSFIALIQGATQASIEDAFEMHIYEGLIGNNEANCLDPDFSLDYCPDDDEDDDEDDEETTIEPMTGTTEPATWPTMVPTTMEIDTTTTV